MPSISSPLQEISLSILRYPLTLRIWSIAKVKSRVKPLPKCAGSIENGSYTCGQGQQIKSTGERILTMDRVKREESIMAAKIAQHLQIWLSSVLLASSTSSSACSIGWAACFRKALALSEARLLAAADSPVDESSPCSSILARLTGRERSESLVVLALSEAANASNTRRTCGHTCLLLITARSWPLPGLGVKLLAPGHYLTTTEVRRCTKLC